MIIRPFHISDLDRINYLNGQPEYSELDPIIPGQAYADIVADSEGQLVAYGINRLLSEAVMTLDHSLPIKDKVKALALLMKEAKLKCCHRQLYTRTQDRQFAAILEKHFNFRESKGILLVSDVEYT